MTINHPPISSSKHVFMRAQIFTGCTALDSLRAAHSPPPLALSLCLSLSARFYKTFTHHHQNDPSLGRARAKTFGEHVPHAAAATATTAHRAQLVHASVTASNPPKRPRFPTRCSLSACEAGEMVFFCSLVINIYGLGPGAVRMSGKATRR